MACCSVSTATRSVCANRRQRLEPPAPYEASTHMNLNIAHTGPALARANGIELTYDTFGDAQPLVLRWRPRQPPGACCLGAYRWGGFRFGRSALPALA